MSTPTVALIVSPNGDVRVLSSKGVIVLSISDHTPNDRVYCYTPGDDGAEIERLIGASPIGHAGDDATSPPPAPQKPRFTVVK